VADIAAVKAELASFEGAQKASLQNAFTYTYGNLSIGASDRGKAGNFLLYYIDGTTSSNANQEFSIAHGLEGTPSVLIPVMQLNQVGSMLVPLTVSRAADNKRVYLKSSSTSAAITVLVG